MSEPVTVPVPSAVRELIISNNQLLRNYQQELSDRVVMANMEMMRMMGLDPQEGWKLDVEKMVYTKEPAQVGQSEPATLVG
jgi:hypothetical protein